MCKLPNARVRIILLLNFRDIIRYLFPSEPIGSVHCYELLSMHIGTVSNHFVVTSCEKLTRLLWEASGEANSPVNLL